MQTSYCAMACGGIIGRRMYDVFGQLLIFSLSFFLFILCTVMPPSFSFPFKNDMALASETRL